jgi:hypothetical protein
VEFEQFRYQIASVQCGVVGQDFRDASQGVSELKDGDLFFSGLKITQ